VPLTNRTFGKRLRIEERRSPPPVVAPELAPVKAKESVPPQQETPDIDLRRGLRKRILFKAMIAFGEDCGSVIDCLICDFSDAGARVRVRPGPDLPATVVLLDPQKRLAYRSNVSWRRNNFIGLTFASRHELDKETTPELAALRQHCIEYELR